MLKRIKNTGANLLVLGIAIAIFIIAFIVLNGLAAAQRPPTTAVLVANTDMSMGHVITSADVAEKTVYQDETTSLFMPASEANMVVGQVTGSPLFAGQPIPRSVLIGPASEQYRLASALANYPDYTLFPLPLDGTNIVAPEIESFYPEDLVNLTAVIGARPTHPDDINAALDSMQVFAPPTETPEENAQAGDTEKMLHDTYPPLAKDLFPQGVRVLSVQGLPPAPQSTGADSGDANAPDTSAPMLAAAETKPMLLLLVPNDQREKLALALQVSDMLIVSLIPRGTDSPTNGFTYWDLESIFQADRSRNLGIPLDNPVPLVTGSANAAPYPITVTPTITSTNPITP